MRWYTLGEITLETALFYCSNPTEFALQVQGIAGSSDRSFEGFQADKPETAPGGGKTAPKPAPGPRPGPGAGGGTGGAAKGGGDLGISRDPFAT
jgi:hypothetical protein